MSSISTADVRLIAFYLTQFHPIPENDEWWGKGFTEWTNVTKAQPLYEGHYQPHLPADFGFYDLRVRETRRDQIRVARENGIDGFCYHYYWFSGKRLLENPLDDMLADPKSDMPFCLCWANENWTRRWDAAEHHVLIAQEYRADDDLRFIQDLMPYLMDPRYIHVDGAPILIVYRPQQLPDPKHTIDVWRDYCKSVGIERIHLCAALTHGNQNYASMGFDSGVEFPPHNLQLTNQAAAISFYQPFAGSCFNYADVARAYVNRNYSQKNIFRCITPAWDNTARTGNRSLILTNSSPSNYEHWLDLTIRATRREHPGENRLVFINAWNEWAEGCHLEPDLRYGTSLLEATRSAKSGGSKIEGFTLSEASGDPTAQRTIAHDLRQTLRYHSWMLLGRLATTLKKFPRIRRVLRQLWYR